ncbi:hypothetical protein C8R44DRAFT_736731 [Mycena epipterygia]|nr:hypothetical protein C8R44DRAFT_736731 [Mycena epipterygia]
MPVGMGICGTEVLIPPNEINPNTVAAHAEEQQQHQGGYLCESQLNTVDTILASSSSFETPAPEDSTTWISDGGDLRGHTPEHRSIDTEARNSDQPWISRCWTTRQDASAVGDQLAEHRLAEVFDSAAARRLFPLRILASFSEKRLGTDFPTVEQRMAVGGLPSPGAPVWLRSLYPVDRGWFNRG